MIRVERHGPVTRLVLDRPERRNALTQEMIEALGAAVAQAEADAGCRALVLTGAGGNFSAGRDLTGGVGERGLGPVLARDRAWTDIFHCLHRAATPSVALVDGYAVAGGFTLAMGCDFVLATRAARFGASEMQNGFAAAINAPVLSRLLGPRLALELLVFGEPATAERLYEMGLVNRLADDAEGLAQAEADFVGRLAALDPEGVRLTKELNRAALRVSHDDALQMGNNVNALIAASGRFDEAAAAYTARRAKKD